MQDFQKMVVLIDADNTQLSKIEDVLHEVSTYGRIVVKKAYGNFTKPNLKKWENKIKSLAIKAYQQYDYVAGKNTTDIAIVIDAMDLLHTGMYDAVVIVSSDSDFTPLAVRLRENGTYVIGVGEKKTPEAFCNACDNFIYLELLGAEEAKPAPAPKAKTSKPRTQKAKGQKNAGSSTAEPQVQVEEKEPEASRGPVDADINEIHALLRIAFERFDEDDEGYVDISNAGVYIKRVKPEFDPKSYGYPKLSKLIRDFPSLYDFKTNPGGGFSYRCRPRG